MTLTLSNEGRSNFHNVRPIDIRVRADQFVRRSNRIESVALTASQVRRINAHFCGISDCLCGSGPCGMEQIDHDTYIIHLTDEQQREADHA